MVTTTRRTDRLLLLEVGLVLLLVMLSIVLFMRPAAEGSVETTWWNWLPLAGLFFGVVGLHTWRRRHRGRAALHEAIREEAERSG